MSSDLLLGLFAAMAAGSGRQMPQESYDPSSGWHFYDNLRSIDCSRDRTQALCRHTTNATVCCAEVIQAPTRVPLVFKVRILNRGPSYTNIGFGILGAQADQHGQRFVGEIEMTNSLGLMELRGEQTMCLRDKKIGTFSTRFERGTEIVLKLEGSKLSFFADGRRYNCPELDACSFSGTYRFGVSLCHEGQEVAIIKHSGSSSDGDGGLLAALLLAALSNDSTPKTEYRPGSGFRFHDYISGIDTKSGDTVAYSNERIRATMFTKEVFNIPTSSPVSINFRVNKTNNAIFVCGVLSADSRGKHLLGEDDLRDSVGIALLRDKVAVMRNGQQLWNGTLAQSVGPGSIVTMTVNRNTLSFNVDGSNGQDISLTLSGQCRFGVSFSDDEQEFEITPFTASPPRSTQASPTVTTPSPPKQERPPPAPAPPVHNLREEVLQEDEGWSWVSGNSSTVQDSGATAKSTASDQYAYTPQVVCNRTNEKVRCGGCGKPLWESWWECRQCGSGFAFCNRCFQDTECAQLHQHGRDSFSVNHGGTLFVLALRVVAAKGSGLSFGLIGSSDANFGTNSIVVSSDGGTVHVLVGNQRIQTYGKQRCFNDGDIVELRLQKSTFVLLLNGDLLHKEAASPNTKYRFAVRFHSPQQQVQIQRRAPLKLGLACELACTASQLTAEAGICGMTLKSGNFAAGVVVGFDHDDNSVRVALPDVEGGVWLPHAALRCASNVDPPRLLMPLAKGMTVMRFNDWKWGAVDGGWQNPEQGRVLDASLGKAKVQFRSTTADVRYGRQPDGSLYFDVIACLERGYRVARNVFYWTYGDQDSGQFGRVVTMNGTNVTVRWDNGSEAQYSFGAKGTFDIQRVDDDHSPDPSVPIVPPTPEVIFAKGTSVLLRGLTSHAELNGKSATVQTYDGAAGRYVVVLDDDSTVRVQPQNLMTTTKTNITVNRATNSSNGSAKVPPSPGPATDPKPTVPTDPTPAAFPSGVEVRKDGTILAPIAAVESKKIAREDFDLYNKEKLGSGSFGLVFKGMFAGKPIAIKKINPTQEVDDEILREVLFGSVLSHPNILTISNWSVAPDNDGVSQYYLIMPLVEPGSLRKALDSIATDHGPAKGGKLGWKKFFKVATGVLDALHHLATRPTPVVHRDLKPENILVDKDFFPQVSDFGLAKRLEQTMKMSRKMNASTSGVCGTWSYMSPEALQGQTTKPPTDMYSYGCILWELLHNKIPRDGTQDQINTAVVNRQEPLVISPDVPAPLAELITKSTLWDAQRRLTASNARALLKAEFQKCESGDPLYAEP